ncbi:sensor domain-containing diguanylate cyclase, partial [PVC group bacterium]|nr:sensor domain-containing diguanylate cyclase [PVC group bacterium]
GQVMATGKPVRVDNAKEDPVFRHRRMVTEFGIQSYLGVPVRRQDNTVVGALGVMNDAPTTFKSIDLELLTILAERVGSELERESYDHELRELKEKFRRLSIMDEMTGIYNRRYLLERLDKEIKRAKRYTSKLSFLMADVDHFKVINDAHGHVFGDLVLKEVALVMGNCLRDVDLVARYGGEEYAMVLPETSGESAMIAAERLCAMVRNHVFADDRNPTRLTISVGVAAFSPETSADCQQLIDKADQALCDAKRDGGDCVRRST